MNFKGEEEVFNPGEMIKDLDELLSVLKKPAEEGAKEIMAGPGRYVKAIRCCLILLRGEEVPTKDNPIKEDR